MPEQRPFDVKIDHDARIITIQGIRYCFDLFDHLGFGAEGALLKLGKRENGVITIHQIEETTNVS